MTSRVARVLLRACVAAVVVLPLAAPVAAQASPEHRSDLTVMTQNLYLGAGLAPVITAPDATAFLVAAAQLYGTVLFTNFPARAAAIADEVAARRPDLIGLQEVSRWTATGPTPAPSLDYLVILQAQLASRGLHYDVAAVSDNADVGPVPLVAPCNSAVVGACLLRLQDRDVILVNSDAHGLKVANPRHGTYATQEVLGTPVGPLSFARGWATVDARYRGEQFRFAVTHLETEDFPAVQQAQGQEFLAAVRTKGAVVAVGDFNSAADGSTTTTYAGLTADYFRDGWAATHQVALGYSCCQNGTLTNPVSALHSRIDLVLTHHVHAVRTALVGDSPFEAVPPLWPSDHAGVVATLRLH
jgi:endonuclease/exonuclease/phosphatase family metal-dependent hydrolase